MTKSANESESFRAVIWDPVAKNCERMRLSEQVIGQTEPCAGQQCPLVGDEAMHFISPNFPREIMGSEVTAGTRKEKCQIYNSRVRKSVQRQKEQEIKKQE